MKPRKTPPKEAAGSGCMARLVRLFCSWGMPRGDDQRHLRQNHKMYEKLRNLADFLDSISIILCLGMVYMVGVGICLLWGKTKEVISPPEKMKHEQYDKNLNNGQYPRPINQPKIRWRAYNGGNSHHDTSKDTDHRIGRKEGVEESIPVNLVEFFHVHSLNFLPNNQAKP